MLDIKPKYYGAGQLGLQMQGKRPPPESLPNPIHHRLPICEKWLKYYGINAIRWFGDMESPMTKTCARMATPIAKICFYCDSVIKFNDDGVELTHLTIEKDRNIWGNVYAHYRCFMAEVLGVDAI